MSKKIAKKIPIVPGADHFSGVSAIVYTDGGANKTAGGWACAVVFADGRPNLECCGFEYGGKVGGMELTAILCGLKLTAGEARVRVVSDSQYALNACGQWLDGWVKKGWRTGDGSPVKNQEILKLIRDRKAGRKFEWVWVKGHSGHIWNEHCDKLCSSQIRLAEAMGTAAHHPGTANRSSGFRVMASD